MRWTGDAFHDLILSLLDDSGTVIFGQAIRADRGWNGFDYSSEITDELGHFDTADQARDAVWGSVVDTAIRDGLAARQAC